MKMKNIVKEICMFVGIAFAQAVTAWLMYFAFMFLCNSQRPLGAWLTPLAYLTEILFWVMMYPVMYYHGQCSLLGSILNGLVWATVIMTILAAVRHINTRRMHNKASQVTSQ